MKKVFASILAALFTFAACSDEEIIPDQEGKEDQEQTEEPGGEEPGGEEPGETPGEDPGEDPGTTPPPTVFEWPNDPTAFDYELDLNESRKAEYNADELATQGISNPGNRTLTSAVTTDGVTYGGPGISFYGNRMTIDQVKKGFFSEEYPDVIPSRCYQSFKINRPGSVTFFQSIGTAADASGLRVPTFCMAVVTTVNGVTSAKIVDEVTPEELTAERPGNPNAAEFQKYHVTLTVTEADMAGITEAATVYIYHKNPKVNSLLVHYYQLTWKSGAETNASQRKPKILLAGDSIVREYKENEAPQAGWGQYLAAALGGNVKVKNHAVGGESTKSFKESGKWNGLIEETLSGDVVLIWFMHNDKGSSKDGYRTDAATTYRDYLKEYISDVRGKGAVPVLITSILPRQFENGQPRRSLGDFPDAMRAVAQETETLLIDCEQWSYDWLAGLGETGSEQYYVVDKRDPEKIDNTHITHSGAEIVAKFIADELVRLGVWIR